MARALAAAVLGDGEAVCPVPVDPADRLSVLTAGDVDLVSCNLTWSLRRGRATRCSSRASPATTPRASSSARRTGSGSVAPGGPAGRRRRPARPAPRTSRAGSAARRAAVEPVPHATPAAALAAYASGECSAYVLDRVAPRRRAPAARRSGGASDPGRHDLAGADGPRRAVDRPRLVRLCRWLLNCSSRRSTRLASKPARRRPRRRGSRRPRRPAGMATARARPRLGGPRGRRGRRLRPDLRPQPRRRLGPRPPARPQRAVAGRRPALPAPARLTPLHCPPPLTSRHLVTPSPRHPVTSPSERHPP